MKLYACLLVCAYLFSTFSAAQDSHDGSLEWVAERLLGPSESGCPLALTAQVIPTHSSYVLSFRMRNTTSQTLRFSRQELPWAGIYSVRIAALTADGDVLETGFPPIDDFGVDKVELVPGQVLSGDYDLSWRWNPQSDPPTGFPPDQLIVLIWTYRVAAEGLNSGAAVTCSGINAFRTPK